MKIQFFLQELIALINSGKNDNFYKTQRGFFQLFKRLTAKSTMFNLWFIKFGYISTFVEFYMDKQKSINDKAEFSLHEQALEPLLRTIANMVDFKVNFYDAENEDPLRRDGKLVELSDRDARNITNVDFASKMMSENYSKTNFEATKRIIKSCTRGGDYWSMAVISICLKEINLLMLNDDGICYIEVIIFY